MFVVLKKRVSETMGYALFCYWGLAILAGGGSRGAAVDRRRPMEDGFLKGIAGSATAARWLLRIRSAGNFLKCDGYHIFIGAIFSG